MRHGERNLRETLKDGMTIYFTLRSVYDSGRKGTFEVYAMTEKGLKQIGLSVANFLSLPFNPGDRFIRSGIELENPDIAGTVIKVLWDLEKQLGMNLNYEWL